MILAVCAMADLAGEVERRRPAAIVSLLGPTQPLPPVLLEAPRLVLRFNDIAEPREDLTLPDPEMVARLLAFAAEAAPTETILLHCWMGISRSPAAAFILACARDASRPEAQIAMALRRAAPSATPNPLLVRLADERLERGGRMSAAIAGIGRGGEATVGTPFELEA
jgi:predicted protein tyrosine phosphatase